MAGFFGLFDYNKEGPGVDKNAPRKKGFIVFFEIYFRKFWKLICANLLYVLIALPMLTAGLAEAGLTYITRNFARQKHAFISGDFFDTIKKNWKQALPMGIINLVVTLLVGFSIYWYFGALGAEEVGIFNYIAAAVSMSFYILFTFAKYYMSMLVITFKFRLKQIYKNSFILAVAGLKRNLLISLVLLVLYAAGVLIAWYGEYIGLTVLLLLYIFWFPAFRMYLIQYNIFPVIKKCLIDPYYREHPGEDREAKRALNLEDEEEEKPGEEEAPIFQDTGRTQKEEEEAPPARTLPKQYSEQEMRKGRRIYKKDARIDDDDDTI